MDKTEMRAVLSAHLADYRGRSHEALARLVEAKHADASEQRGPSGAEYQLEVNFVWDGARGGDIRVCGSIDEKPQRPLHRLLPIYVSAVTEDFIKRPDGSFVEEQG